MEKEGKPHGRRQQISQWAQQQSCRGGDAASNIAVDEQQQQAGRNQSRGGGKMYIARASGNPKAQR